MAPFFLKTNLAMFARLFTKETSMTHESFTLATAFTLGLLHSLEPSHAKAILASYFLDRKRTVYEALVFAFTVTLAHTVSIYALALAGYTIAPFIQSELTHGHDHGHESRVELWATFAGGVLMILIGIWMFWNERRAHFHKQGVSCCHNHDRDEPHGHFFHHHDYHHDHPQPSSLRQIFVLGFCSGAIPCMSGLTVLIGAWSTAKPLYGMFLVATFSLGLGCVVLAMCLTMQQAPRLMERYWKGSAEWTRFLPVISSAIIFLTGVWIVWSSWSGLPHTH
jgi:nickel/cobalt transporter (NicO) family protein